MKFTLKFELDTKQEGVREPIMSFIPRYDDKSSAMINMTTIGSFVGLLGRGHQKRIDWTSQWNFAMHFDIIERCWCTELVILS